MTQYIQVILPEIKNPGIDALLRIQKGLNVESDTYLAISYLAERVELLEKKLVERGTRFKTPTPQEVSDYAQSIGYDLVGITFVDYYASRDWKIAKQPMKDWKAAVRYWKSLKDSRDRQKQKSESDTIPIKN